MMLNIILRKLPSPHREFPVMLSRSPGYKEVELKASIMSYRFSFARDFMNKIEADQQQGGHN